MVPAVWITSPVSWTIFCEARLALLPIDKVPLAERSIPASPVRPALMTAVVLVSVAFSALISCPPSVAFWAISERLPPDDISPRVTRLPVLTVMPPSEIKVPVSDALLALARISVAEVARPVTASAAALES